MFSLHVLPNERIKLSGVGKLFLELLSEFSELWINFNEVAKRKLIERLGFVASFEEQESKLEELKKKFVCPIKSNRRIALTEEERNNGKYVNISTIDIKGGSSRLIYLEGYEKPLRLVKQVVKNGDDDESTYLYLVTNDIDLSFDEVLEIYKRRWKVEEYHKSLKQNLKIEHSPTKVETSQRNHIHLAVLGFIKLEKLRLNYKMNHFAIKEKIYIEALKIAYQKVGELQVA